VGVAAPLFQPLAGRTRPRNTSVILPESPQPSRRTGALAPASHQDGRDLAEAARVIVAYSNLFGDEALRALQASAYRDAVERSRAALERLFQSVASDPARSRAVVAAA
jgi:hypothetical protein